MEIRTLTDNDFFKLLEMYLAMGKSIDVKFTDYQIISTLVNSVATYPTFVAFGMFDNGKMIGMSCGWGTNNAKFYFSGLYIEKQYRLKVQKLIDHSFEAIKKAGYKGWEIDATNENIASIMEKYGAKPTSTKYCKEF